MNRKQLLGGVAAAALVIGGAMQAQATDAPEYMAPPPGWTGFHVGVGGGVNFLLSEDSKAWAYEWWTDTDKVAGADLGQEGFFGTVEGGFDFQRNRIVFGILANYDFGKKVAEFGGGSFEEDKFVGARLTMTNSWAIAGRLGVLNQTQNTLWYGLIGYTGAKLKGEECYLLLSYDSCDRDGGLVVTKNAGGLTLGAGVESLLNDRLSLKLEYRYTDLGSFSGWDGDVGWVDNGNDDEGFEFDPVDHSVRAVLSLRFGGVGMGN